MLSKIRYMLINHVKNNKSRYIFLVIAFITGVTAGAFTVNGLGAGQREELGNYIQGFMQLLDKQNVDGGELFQLALVENAKLILALWVLGVTIIGIPFIFLLVGIRGFITGFSSGFLIKTLGVKGMLFSTVTLLPKEIIMIPCIIALAVNGINFSLNIIKNKSSKHLLKENLKTDFFAYCFVTLFYSTFILGAILIDSYIIPVLIKMTAPLVTG